MMNKQLILAVCLLAMYSCSPGTGTSSPPPAAPAIITDSTTVKPIESKEDPLTATVVKYERWNNQTKSLQTISTRECRNIIFFLKDRIRMRGEENKVFYYRGNGGFSEEDGVAIAVVSCYDERGNDCSIMQFLEVATANRYFIVTYEGVEQYTYSVTDFIPDLTKEKSQQNK